MSCLNITRKNSLKDFLDRELLIYALAYSGTFSAFDRWISNPVRMSRQGRDSVFHQFDDRLDALKALLDRYPESGHPCPVLILKRLGDRFNDVRPHTRQP